MLFCDYFQLFFLPVWEQMIDPTISFSGDVCTTGIRILGCFAHKNSIKSREPGMAAEKRKYEFQNKRRLLHAVVPGKKKKKTSRIRCSDAYSCQFLQLGLDKCLRFSLFLVRFSGGV